MTWFKVDDAFYRGRKVRRLGVDRIPAVGVWTLAGNWAADNLENNIADGFVPWEIVQQWDPKRRYAKRLIDVHLWDEVEHEGEPGIQFHDWADCNPTKEDRAAEREVWRAKKAAQRARKEPSEDPLSPGDSPETPPETPPESPPETPEGVHQGVSKSSGPHSRPVPSRSTGSPRGVSHVSSRAGEERPPERCPKHANDTDPPPCGACADARRAAARWDETHHQDAKAAVRACTLCDGDGWRYIDPALRSHGLRSGPGARCDHVREPVNA
jgi:hypothetical protein